MALAAPLGHARAHAVVEAAATEALASGRALLDVLAETPEVTAHLDRAQLVQLLDPTRYVGEADAVVDRVLIAIPTVHSERGP